MRSIALSSFASVLVLSVASAAPAQDDDRVKKLEERLERLERDSGERIRRLERENDGLQRRLDQLTSELERAQSRPGVSTDELQRQIDLLAAELERSAAGSDVVAPAGEGVYGFGPAASKIYRKDHGLSLGGYGEILYANEHGTGNPATADLLRAVLYVGYKFDDHWVFNSEIEFEHANTDKGGEAAVEFAYLDYLLQKEVNFRGGLVLMPVGLVNEMHEPTTFLGATRPLTEDLIIPTTWRELGVGAFGQVGDFSYRAYLTNGLDASGFEAEGLHEGSHEGSEALAEDAAGVARLDYVGTPGFIVGASGYYGNSGQNQAGFGPTPVSIVEAHAEWKRGGLWLRALGALAHVGDVAQLNAALGLTGADSVGERLEGYYVEAGYDVLSCLAPESGSSLYPFARWEFVDTQAKVPSGFASSAATREDVLTLGLHFKPISPVVVKLDYQFLDGGDGRLEFALGYSF